MARLPKMFVGFVVSGTFVALAFVRWGVFAFFALGRFWFLGFLGSLGFFLAFFSFNSFAFELRVALDCVNLFLPLPT